MPETYGTRPLSWYAEQAPNKLEEEEEEEETDSSSNQRLLLKDLEE